MHENSGESATQIDWDRLRPVLDSVIRELKGGDREAVLLRFFEKRPFAEIGASLYLNEDTARKRVDRALDRLRIVLAKRGITSTATALALVLENQAVTAAPSNWAIMVTDAALTGAARGCGSTTTVLKILDFMSITKATSIIATTVAILIVTIATREVLASRAEQTSSIVAAQDYDALLAHLHELRQRAQAAEQDQAQLRKFIDDARAARMAEESLTKRASQTARAAERRARDPVAEGNAFLAAHPEVKQALVERAKARVAARFHSLYQALGLTPPQIEHFENLLIEREGVTFPTDEGELILRPGTGLSNNEVEDRMHELLGDSGYQQYQEVAQMVPARALATQLASALYFTDTPLTAQQAERIVQIVTNGKVGPANTRPGQYDWDAIIRNSQGVLSDPQLAALEGMQEQDQFNQALKLTIKHSQPSAGNTGGSSSQ